MLVDKYKPLRTGSIISSDVQTKNLVAKQPSLGRPIIVPDQKELALSEARVTSSQDRCSPSASNSSSTRVDGEYKPWLVTFKAPFHATVSPQVKYGHFSSKSPTLGPSISSIEDPRARAEARRRRKLVLNTGRLTQAREAMLDYKLAGSLDAIERTGVHQSNTASHQGDDMQDADADAERGPSKIGEASSHSKSAALRPRNPQSIRAWNSLIEEKIEVRRPYVSLDKYKFPNYL